MNYIDLAEIKSLATTGPYGGDRYLSPETVTYLLAVANSQRWQWRNSGDRLSDSQWDEAEEIIGQALDELLG
jgi:hypothetical protein